jgi:hypothetical protein
MNTLPAVWSKNLACDPCAPAKPEDRVAERKAALVDKAGGRAIRVLVAEDNPVNRGSPR